MIVAQWPVAHRVAVLCRCSTKLLWDLWWLGDKGARIAPYRQIKASDLYQRCDHGLLSKAKYVMKALVARCPQGRSYVDVSRLGQPELDALFEVAYVALCGEIYADSTLEVLDDRRVGDRSYVTIYDLAKKQAA
jgi:hypothetical protein